MKAEGDGGSFGPYDFALSPAETEAAAGRFGLRAALGGSLIANHLAPFAAFVLLVLFASILALTGLVDRRAGRAALILAAVLFLSQRLVSYWRMRQARSRARAAIEAMAAEGAQTVSVDASGVTRAAGGRTLRLAFAACQDAEDAHGLIYFWPREGPPIILPVRALGDGEAGTIVARARRCSSARTPPTRADDEV
jgi:hypothetical protein